MKNKADNSGRQYFSNKLKSLMKERAVSSQKFADSLEVCLPTVSKWIEGQAMPQPEKLKRIAEFFNTEPAYFLEKQKNVVSQELTAKRIFQLRQEHCLSRAMLARAIDVSLQTIVLWENGSKPSIRGINKLSEYFGISPEYFTNEKYVLKIAKTKSGLPIPPPPPLFSGKNQRYVNDKISEYLAPWREAAFQDPEVLGYVLTTLKKHLPQADLSLFQK